MDCVTRALQFKETNRDSLDLGSSCTSIYGGAHSNLKKYLSGRWKRDNHK